MNNFAVRRIRTGLVAILAVTSMIELQGQQKLRIVVVEGEDAVNVIQQKTAVAPVVEVRDQNNQPVAGVTVTFAMKGGNASATLGSGVRQLVATTDAAGRASVAVNPVANGAVQIEATASLGGQTASTTIVQTNVATAAEATQLSSGGGHTGLIVTSAVLAGGGIAGWQYYERSKDEPEPLTEDPGCFISGISRVNVAAQGGQFTALFDTSCKWSAAVDQDWLALTGPTAGEAGGGLGAASGQTITLTFTVQPNTAATSRTARIAVTTRHGQFIIEVVQPAGRATANSSFVLEARALTVSNAAGCGASIAIESMQVQRMADGGATVWASMSSGCGAIATYTSTATARGAAITARLVGAGTSGLPASIEFDGSVEGDYIRGFIIGADFRQPVALRQR